MILLTVVSHNRSEQSHLPRYSVVGRILDGWWRISATNSYLLFRFPELDSLPLSSSESFDRMPAPSNASKPLRQ